MKNKPVPNNLKSIKTEYMTIRRVKIANYLGLVVDENLHWGAHVDNVYASLVNTLEYLIIWNRLLLYVMLDNCISLLLIPTLPTV